MAPHLIRKAKTLGFHVYGTTHRGNFDKFQFNNEVEKVFPLQLADIEKTSSEIANLGSEKYSRIISLIGATYVNKNYSESIPLLDYYQMFSLNLNLAHSLLLGSLASDGTFIYMSSRAAIYGSFDAHYAAVKASNTAFLLSVQKSCEIGQSVVPIASSLIESSHMYNRMSPENREVHRQKTGNSLVQIEEIVDLLLKKNFSISDPSYKNGIYQIGRDMK